MTELGYLPQLSGGVVFPVPGGGRIDINTFRTYGHLAAGADEWERELLDGLRRAWSEHEWALLGR